MTTGKRKRGEQTATTTDQTATTTAVQGTAKRTITFEEASAIVQDQQFWQRGEYVMKLLAPVVKKTELLETDGCSVAMVYQTVVDLLDNLQYCNPEDLVAVQVRSLIEDQKFDTMRIAFLLDPATNPDDFLGDDLMKELYDIPVVAKRLGYSEDMQKAVFREANIFVNVKWDWSPEQQANAATCPPVEWWGHKRDLYPALFEFARKVFTIPTSSAAAEVSRSTHKYFHSTLFVNGIKPEAMRKLGFIFSSRKSSVVEVPEVH